MAKIGIIACQKNWRKGCPGLCSHVLCFEAIHHKLGPFKQLDNPELVSMIPCTGCPGESILGIVSNMVVLEKIDTVVFPCCVLHNHCPNLAETVLQIKQLYNCKVILGNFHKEPKLLPYLQPEHKCCVKEYREIYA